MLSVGLSVSAEEAMTKEQAKVKARELIEIFSNSTELEVYEEYGRGNWFALEEYLTDQIYNNPFIYEDWYDIWEKSTDDYSYVDSAVQNLAAYASEKKGVYGLSFVVENEKIVVFAASYGSPAREAGIVPGAVLVSYGETAVPEAATQEDLLAFQNFVSEADALPLTVLLPTGETKAVTITRADFSEDAVIEDVLIEDGTAYIIVPSFNDKTDEYFASAYKKAEEAGVKSIIIDLRTNTGGYLTPAYNMINMIVPEKLPMYYEKHSSNLSIATTDGLGSKTWRPDIVCLTSKTTASAAELFAGVLQYHGYARLVGESTYGKGSGQSMVELTNGNDVVVTSFYTYLPNGRSWEGKGLTPDYVITDDPATEADEVLTYAYSYVDGEGTVVEEPGYYGYVYYLKKDDEPDFIDTFANLQRMKRDGVKEPVRFTYVSSGGMKMIVNTDDAYAAGNIKYYFGIYGDQSKTAEEILKKEGSLPEKARVIMTAIAGEYGFAPTISLKMADKPEYFYYYDSLEDTYTAFEPPYVYEDGVLRFNIEVGGIIIASPVEIK